MSFFCSRIPSRTPHDRVTSYPLRLLMAGTVTGHVILRTLTVWRSTCQVYYGISRYQDLSDVFLKTRLALLSVFERKVTDVKYRFHHMYIRGTDQHNVWLLILTSVTSLRQCLSALSTAEVLSWSIPSWLLNSKKKKNLGLRTRLHCLCNQVDALCRCSLEGLTGLAVCSALRLSKQRQTYSGAVCAPKLQLQWWTRGTIHTDQRSDKRRLGCQTLPENSQRFFSAWILL